MSRAESAVLGTLLLTALAVVLAGVAGVAAVELVRPPEATPPVALSADVDAATGRIALDLESGPTLDVRAIRLRIAVDGEPLAHQPPVPFFSARGFSPGPTGPFNAASDPRWERGERASLAIAGTNEPAFAEGATVRVELYRDGLPIAAVETVAR